MVRWMVLLSLQGEVGRLTVVGQRKAEGSILHLLGGCMLVVREGGDIRGVRVRGMLALVCPGSDILLLKESLSDSRPLMPSLIMALT